MRHYFKSGFLLTAVAVMSLISFKAEAALLVAGRGNGSVLRYDEVTGDFIDTFISSGSGGLKAPSSLAFGPDGDLYVADYDNASILRYNATTGAFIDTFISSGSGGIAKLETLSFGPDNNLYLSGLDGSGVLRYDGKTGAFLGAVVASVPSTGVELSSPNFTFGPDNDLYISSVLPTSGVLRYDEQSGNTSIFISPSSSPQVPGGITFGPDGDLYVNDFSPNASIKRYNGLTGAFLDDFVTAGSGGLSQASRLVFRPDNTLYVTSLGTDSVLRYNALTGDFLGTFVSSGSGGLDQPIGIAFSPLPVPEPTSWLGILGLGAYLFFSRYKMT